MDSPSLLFDSVQAQLAQAVGFGLPRPLLKWITGLDSAERVLSRAQGIAGGCIFDRLLAATGAGYRCVATDLDRIPQSGPAILIANHPFGLLDGLIVASLANRRRSDFRVLANSLLASIPEVRQYVIPVNVLSREVNANGHALRAALRWVQSGGALIVFPAGEVAAPHGLPPAVVDSQWNTGVLRLAKAARAPVIPVHLAGRNSAAFQAAGMVHPMLRTALLNRELLNKRGTVTEVSVGRPIPANRLQEVRDNELAGYLRQRTYLLGERKAESRKPWSRAPAVNEPLAPPAGAELLRIDIDALPQDALLVRGSGYAVYLAAARQLPNVLREIGRLREAAFRAVGEGTGRALDLDAFDDHYLHLILWSERNQEIAGGYRMGRVDEIVRSRGVRGLYTQSLFELPREFVDRMSSGLELGRSFVRQEYQRSVHPLYYLWKGISAWVGRNPRYRYLFGPVSISNGYTRAARELMVQYFRSARKPVPAARVRARRPFRTRPIGARFLAGIARNIGDVHELSELIADLELDGKGIPVLLRHYLGLGAEVLEFNVDRNFANALDALIVVDLTRTSPAVLEKYMGKDLLAAYLAHQGTAATRR
jgi:putative hemolysin